jgi:hypothetical protein
MNAPLSRREFLQAGGALVVGFSIPGHAYAQRPRGEISLGKTLDATESTASSPSMPTAR